MGITKDRGRYYWVKWVPKRYAGLVLGADRQPVTQVRRALRTDSLEVARVKAAQIEAAQFAEWEALLAGDTDQARRHYEAARNVAQSRGFTYRPMNDLLEGNLEDLLTRLMSLTDTSGRLTAGPAATEAVLGAVPEVLPSMRDMLAEYFSLVETRHVQKSESQKIRWRNQKTRAVNNFLTVIGPAKGNGIPFDPPVNRITRADALKFRDWWSARIKRGMKIGSANKELGHLSEIFSTWPN